MAQGTKTCKRELAIALLVWFAYLVETKEESILEVVVWPVFTYSALAFGLDWFGKSSTPFGPTGGMLRPPETPHRRRTKRSSEHPDREGEFPDNREFDPERDK